MGVKLLSCPKCGDVPEVGYVCGEFFIMSAVHPVGECFCGSYCEMHSVKGGRLKPGIRLLKITKRMRIIPAVIVSDKCIRCTVTEV